MWQHNVYYVCVTFRVVRYVGHSERHAHIIKIMLPHHHD